MFLIRKEHRGKENFDNLASASFVEGIFDTTCVQTIIDFHTLRKEKIDRRQKRQLLQKSIITPTKSHTPSPTPKSSQHNLEDITYNVKRRLTYCECE